MQQDDPEIPVSRHPAPESVGRNWGTGNILNRIAGVASLATLTTGSVLWGVESWMLPESLWRTGDWIWLSMAGAGGLGFAGFMISLGCGRHRLRLAVLWLVGSFGMVGGVRWIGGELALNRFFLSQELGGQAADGPESLSQRLAKWLEDRRLGVPAWLQSRVSDRRAAADPPPMHRLLAASRWPVRRAFVRRMLRDDISPKSKTSAAKSPRADDGVLAMWQELRKLSDPAAAGNKQRIYGALFHLAPWVPVDDRFAMRRDFLEYFRKTPLPINQWPDTVMDDIRQSRYFYPKGEGIPWEDDA